ncbi:hypothetical protein SEA_CHRIS_77 [Mycobacterium phage Chris]|uniref:Lipoprotein n=1 Tax=Mycobacterium phage Chris TaxID=2725626 RepID=A0A6M3SXW5_9CAUD|nr:hypothetical protein I5G96_gp028 [Mycobacterium phage Chris]QJD50479.1 hypothetical protein SEA_CHRIS_77 [Mycobacterium phage Chris]
MSRAVLVVLVMLAAFGSVALTACGRLNPEVSRYTDVCRASGGYVSAEPQAFVVDYSCVGQTSGPPLPMLAR